MLCPRCGRKMEGMICGSCGYDGSRDYLRYPTLFHDLPEAAEKPTSAEQALAQKAQYDAASSLEETAGSPDAFKAAALLFEQLARQGYRDSGERSRKCRDRAASLDREQEAAGNVPVGGDKKGKKPPYVIRGLAAESAVARNIGKLDVPGAVNFRYTSNSDGTVSITGYLGMETTIRIPSSIDGRSVTSIGKSAFSGCSSLAVVSIPNSVTSIGNSAFSGCSSLTGLSIPERVTSIGHYAFFKCSGLISLSIPDGVTSIEFDTFYGCSSLASLSIPNSVTSIGNCAFSGCSSLTSLSIPDGVTSIESDTFYGCSSLASVSIPDSVTSIGNCAFYGCSSLTSLSIPERVTGIESDTFNDCSSLAGVSIPSSVTNIGNCAFSGCSGLKDVYYGGAKAQWEAIRIGSDNDFLTSATIHFNS